MTTPRAWTRSDSIAAARDAVVADQRVGEDDDLAGVGGVGDRLLVAGHRGVEDDLAGDRLAGGRRGTPSKRVAVLEQDVALAHAATPRREAAQAEGDLAGGDGHQDPAGQRCARRTRSCCERLS